MSKESFSSKIASDVVSRFHSLEKFDSSSFLRMDDTFKLALCIAYMALSKESIIKKDKKNMDRLGRLTRQVPTTDIDMMFIGSNSPIIQSSLENDSTWIIDNIRDAILHEHFDIDEERRVVIIHNTMYERGLEAEIPFDWFFEYVENDIVKKRFKDHFTMEGFYYNTHTSNCCNPPDMAPDRVCKKAKSYYAVPNHILYKVDIIGERIPIYELDKKIRDLFRKCADIPVTEEEKKKYSAMIQPSEEMYNVDYLVSFYKAKNIVQTELELQYPNSKVIISIDRKKAKLTNRFRNKFNNSYDSYDDLFNKLNGLFQRKSQENLKLISRLYDYANHYLYPPRSSDELMSSIQQIVSGDDYVLSDDRDSNYEDFRMSLKKLREAFLSIYGLCIVSMNKTKMNSSVTEKFLRKDVHAYSRDSFSQYSSELRKKLSRYFDAIIVYEEKQLQYKECPDHVKPMIQAQMTPLLEEIQQLRDYVDYLESNMNVMPISPDVLTSNHRPWEQYRDMVAKLSNKFYKTPYKKENRGQDKKLLKEYILRYFDKAVEEESKYFLGECGEEETIEIIRNCFSHSGRIDISDYHPISRADLNFRDYDDEGNLSAIAHTNYLDFVSFLGNCIEEDSNKKVDENQDGKNK